MIERYFKIIASRDELRRELLAFDCWPQWWPDLRNVRIVETDGRRSIVDLRIAALGSATVQTTIEVDARQDSAIHFRQIRGWFKSYSGNYTFLPAPDGNGTTMRMVIEVDCGILVPKGMVYGKLAANLDGVAEALARRIDQRPDRLPASAPSNISPRAQTAYLREPQVAQSVRARTLVHAFITKRGWEVWIGGKPYRMKSVPW